MSLLGAWRRRSGKERALLLEASALLPRAAIAIRFLAFPRIIAFGAVPLGPLKPFDLPELQWAVDAAARRMPLRAKCFERGLTMQRMLRWRGQDARLHYGIAPGTELSAHVWVSLEGNIVIGGEQTADYQEVGQWP